MMRLPLTLAESNAILAMRLMFGDEWTCEWLLDHDFGGLEDAARHSEQMKALLDTKRQI